MMLYRTPKLRCHRHQSATRLHSWSSTQLSSPICYSDLPPWLRADRAESGWPGARTVRPTPASCFSGHEQTARALWMNRHNNTTSQQQQRVNSRDRADITLSHDLIIIEAKCVSVGFSLRREPVVDHTALGAHTVNNKKRSM